MLEAWPRRRRSARSSRSRAARSRSRIRARSLSRGGPHEARPRALLPRGRRRRAARRGRPAERAGALSRRHRRRVLLPEARARVAAATGSRSCRCAFRPAAPPRRSCRATPPRSPGWPTSACLELHPHPVRADDLDHPDELRVDLDPVPGVAWPQIREVARRRARDARRPRARRLAEDVRLARHPRLRAHRAALDVRRGAARRARARARGRAARAGARDEQVVEGGAPRRLPRLQPEREGSHGRERLFGAARRPTRASRRR